MFRSVLMLLVTLALTLGAADPAIEAGVQELHGTFSGQPFWARLQPADQKFGNNRVLQLVYTPPSDIELVGAHLSDCPFILLDPQVRIVAWNGRDTGSKVVPAAPTGYRVTREITVTEGADKRIDLESRTIAGERGWDLRAAPILLALAWRSGSDGNVRLIDLFGPRHAETLNLTWKDTAINVAGTAYTAAADASGHLHTITAADGTALLTVVGRP